MPQHSKSLNSKSKRITVFCCSKLEREDTIMANKVNLQKIKSEIETKQVKLEKYEKKDSSAQEQGKQIKKMASIEGRKKRTHRLIERLVILESFIDRASEKSNEEIKEIVENPVYLGHTVSRKLSV